MLAQNYLTEVIARIDFNSPITTLSSETAEQIKHGLHLLQPELSLKTVNAAKVNLDEKSVEVEVKGKQAILTFSGGKERFEVLNDTFVYVTSEYVEFPPFLMAFEQGFNTALKVLEYGTIKRIGLRYVNVLKHPAIQQPQDWRRFIADPFIPDYGGLLLDPARQSIRRCMQNSVISDGDLSVMLNQGIWNERFPAKATDESYVLDIDCYADDMQFSAEEVSTRLKRLNQTCYAYFEKIVTKDYLQYLDNSRK